LQGSSAFGVAATEVAAADCLPLLPQPDATNASAATASARVPVNRNTVADLTE
jgi:hypothetical protein